MKIRNGFVSNSSSSSFVVKAKSSMEAYYKVLNAYNEDQNSSWGCYDGHTDDKFSNTHNIDFNGGIFIPYTCNYETYILPSVDGKCRVETCNNHDWSDIILHYIDEDDAYKYWKDNITPFTDVTTNKIKTATAFYNGVVSGDDMVDNSTKSGKLIIELDDIGDVEIVLDEVSRQIVGGYKRGYEPRWYIEED